MTRSGRLFTFGSNEWGQLGLGHNNNVIKPSCVKVLKPDQVTSVACGRYHTLGKCSNKMPVLLLNHHWRPNKFQRKFTSYKQMVFKEFSEMGSFFIIFFSRGGGDFFSKSEFQIQFS